MIYSLRHPHRLTAQSLQRRANLTTDARTLNSKPTVKPFNQCLSDPVARGADLVKEADLSSVAVKTELRPGFRMQGF